MSGFKLKEVLFIILIIFAVYFAWKIFVASVMFLFKILVPVLIIAGIFFLIQYMKKSRNSF